MSAFTATKLDALEKTEDLLFPRRSTRTKRIPEAIIRVEQAIEMTGAEELLKPVLEILRVADEQLEEQVNDIMQKYLEIGGRARE